MHIEPARSVSWTPRCLASVFVVVACVLAGCSTSSEPLTRDEYLKQANAVCAASFARIATAAPGPMSQPSDGAAFFGVVTGEGQGMLENLRKLTPPSELQAAVTTYLAETQAVLDKLKADGPDAFLAMAADPFTDVNAMAREIGLTACGGGQ